MLHHNLLLNNLSLNDTLLDHTLTLHVVSLHDLLLNKLLLVVGLHDLLLNDRGRIGVGLHVVGLHRLDDQRLEVGLRSNQLLDLGRAGVRGRRYE